MIKLLCAGVSTVCHNLDISCLCDERDQPPARTPRKVGQRAHVAGRLEVAAPCPFVHSVLFGFCFMTVQELCARRVLEDVPTLYVTLRLPPRLYRVTECFVWT